MPKFVAALLRVEKDSNPDICHLAIEADSLVRAEALALVALKGDLHGLGWTSYCDTALWGKEQTTLIDVVPEAEDISRRGRGNSRGSEGQDAREARIRKMVAAAVKVKR